MEIEVKLLIEKPSFYPDGVDVSRIEQYYLLPSAGYPTRRVRARTRGGKTGYTYNEKRWIGGLTREENEREIGGEEFLALLGERDPERNAVCKTRYAYPYRGHIMEIDVFDFWDKVAVLEVELGREGEEYSYPDYIKVIADVTDDPRFNNQSLAKKIPDIEELLGAH